MRFKLALDECPHGTQAISLDDEETGTGTRLTSGKCCGRWHRGLSWPMTAADLRAAAEELEAAADSLD